MTSCLLRLNLLRLNLIQPATPTPPTHPPAVSIRVFNQTRSSIPKFYIYAPSLYPIMHNISLPIYRSIIFTHTHTVEARLIRNGEFEGCGVDGGGDHGNFVLWFCSRGLWPVSGARAVAYRRRRRILRSGFRRTAWFLVGAVSLGSHQILIIIVISSARLLFICWERMNNFSFSSKGLYTCPYTCNTYIYINTH